jgi:hypothetical protein
LQFELDTGFVREGSGTLAVQFLQVEVMMLPTNLSIGGVNQKSAGTLGKEEGNVMGTLLTAVLVVFVTSVL